MIIAHTLLRHLCYMIIPYHSVDNDNVAWVPYHSVNNDHTAYIGALS